MVAILIFALGLALVLWGEYAYRRHKGEPVSLLDLITDFTAGRDE